MAGEFTLDVLPEPDRHGELTRGSPGRAEPPHAVLQRRVAVESGHNHELDQRRLESLGFHHFRLDLGEREAADVLVLGDGGIAGEVRRLG